MVVVSIARLGKPDMQATVIDTLRYADRLKRTGLEPGQAEAMSRALNDELTEGLVTRPDLDAAVTLPKGDLDDGVKQLKSALDDGVMRLKGDLDALGAVVSQLRVDVGALGARVDTLERTVDTGFKAVDDRFKAVDDRFKATDGKFEAKFEAVDAKFRYVFLVLALIVGLGLYNATAPHLLGKTRSDSQPVEPAPASSPRQASAVDDNARPRLRLDIPPP